MSLRKKEFPTENFATTRKKLQSSYQTFMVKQEVMLKNKIKNSCSEEFYLHMQPYKKRHSIKGAIQETLQNV